MQFFFNFSLEIQKVIYCKLNLKSLGSLSCVSLGFNRILQLQLTEAKRLDEVLYNKEQQKTLAQWVDEAGSILSSASEFHARKLVALAFLNRIFDLPQTPVKPSPVLLHLLYDREKYKLCNIDYIPGFSPSYLRLPPEEQQIGWPLTLRQKILITQQELLEVDVEEKELDKTFKSPYFTNIARASQRVLIYQGKFYQAKRLFDTRGYTSHGKANFAAYTFNANGEPSVFNHFGVAGQVVHSSMNSGCPIVCAGELKIRLGELERINTYSGHYEPTLYNVYRFINYLLSRNVSIEKLFIHTHFNPKLKLAIDAKFISLIARNKKQLYYAFPAKKLIRIVEEDIYPFLITMDKAIKSYLTSYKLSFFSMKDKCFKTQLISERKALAQALASKLEELVKRTSKGIAIDELEHFAEELDVLKKKNELVSLRYKKKETNGTLHYLISCFSNWLSVFHEKKDTGFLPLQRITAMKTIH